MQGIRKATFETRILWVALFTGLLLVAPCKVRNSIESSLGMATSKVSNKIKATTSKSNCANYTADVVAYTSTEDATNPWVPFLPALLSFTIIVREDQFTQFRRIVTKKVLSLAVPLYILYRHFKVYL